MSLVTTGTEYRGVKIETPARSTLLTVSIGNQKVALTKRQAQLLADYLAEEASYLEDAR
jgi:hypothetical protein